MNLKEVNAFVDYCLDFYGKGGLYAMGATREQVCTALCLHLADESKPHFHADSVDREKVRDILIDQFGLVFPL